MLGNWLKTTILMAAIVALFGTVGAALGGAGGMMIALMLAAAMNVYAYWFSDKAVLKMYGAQEVTADNSQFRSYYQTVKRLAENAQLPMPRVYVINEEQPNAFATGRNPENAAIAFTVGIMKLLNYDELRGVAAHELSHVKHRDILLSTISATVAGAISALANFAMFFGARDENGRPNVIAGILIAVLAPIAAAVIQMAISRSREYLADEGAAYLTGEPLALASALNKIDGYARGIVMQVAEEHPTTAQMMIINPLSGEGQDNLFSTHPQTANRIARLEEIAKNI